MSINFWLELEEKKIFPYVKYLRVVFVGKEWWLRIVRSNFYFDFAGRYRIVVSVCCNHNHFVHLTHRLLHVSAKRIYHEFSQQFATNCSINRKSKQPQQLVNTRLVYLLNEMDNFGSFFSGEN